MVRYRKFRFIAIIIVILTIILGFMGYLMGSSIWSSNSPYSASTVTIISEEQAQRNVEKITENLENVSEILKEIEKSLE